MLLLLHVLASATPRERERGREGGRERARERERGRERERDRERERESIPCWSEFFVLVGCPFV